MASWMVHLRIADELIGIIADIDKTAFVMGNIVPDSGVPNDDWTCFTPPETISHYKDCSTKKIDVDAFCTEYFSDELIKSYSKTEYSFFLGYFVHLLTDIEWNKKVLSPSNEKYAEDCMQNKKAHLWKN